MAYLRVRDLDPAKTWYRDAPGSKTDPLGAISLVVEAINFNHKRITRLDRECPLQVELVVQATGKTVESDTKGRPALIPLHTQGSNQWTLSKRCARCKMHFRITVLSSRHQKSPFVLRITAPTADDLLGYTLRSAHSSGIEVLSKINPIRRKRPAEGDQRTMRRKAKQHKAGGTAGKPAGAVGSSNGGEHGAKMHAGSAAVTNPVSKEVKVQLQRPGGAAALRVWANIAMDVLRRLQWKRLPAPCGRGPSPSNALFQCPCCSAVVQCPAPEPSQAMRQHCPTCDINNLLECASVQRLRGTLGAGRCWEPPDTARDALATSFGRTSVVSDTSTKTPITAGGSTATTACDDTLSKNLQRAPASDVSTAAMHIGTATHDVGIESAGEFIAPASQGSLGSLLASLGGSIGSLGLSDINSPK